MAALGTILTTTPVSTLGVRAGSATVIITDTSKAVSFSSDLSSTNYRVFLQVDSNVAVVLWPSAKATSGFTINLSVGVATTIDWAAIEDG